MTATAPELELTARGLVAPGEDPGRGRERRDQEALRLDRRRVDGGQPPRLPRAALHDRRGRGLHLRRDPGDETIRQRPRTGRRSRSCSRRGSFRDQGRPRRETAALTPTARRSPRDLTGCAAGSRSTARSARASRSGARPTRSAITFRASTASGRTRTRSRVMRRSARRRASSRSSSRSAAGRYAHDRRVGEGDGSRPPGRLHGASRPAGRLPRHAAQAEHGHVRLRGVGPRGRSTRSPSGPRCLLSPRPGCGARDRVPLGRPSDEDATAHLNAMNARGPHPWELSFSYGRALQAPALKAWSGSNVEAGQQAYLRRAKLNSAARSGAYAPEMETASV